MPSVAATESSTASCRGASAAAFTGHVPVTSVAWSSMPWRKPSTARSRISSGSWPGSVNVSDSPDATTSTPAAPTVSRSTRTTASFVAAASATGTVPVTAMFASSTGALSSSRWRPASETAFE
jgi:hypothetical protein